MSEITKYALDRNDNMEPCGNGPWVRSDDHERDVAEKVKAARREERQRAAAMVLTCALPAGISAEAAARFVEMVDGVADRIESRGNAT